MSQPRKATLIIEFSDDTQEMLHLYLERAHRGTINLQDGSTAEIIFNPTQTKREYSRDEPIALDDRDPSNSQPEDFTAPLDPDDDIYQIVLQEQGNK